MVHLLTTTGKVFSNEVALPERGAPIKNEEGGGRVSEGEMTVLVLFT
jgi:hypothetical protein